MTQPQLKSLICKSGLGQKIRNENGICWGKQHLFSGLGSIAEEAKGLIKNRLTICLNLWTFFLNEVPGLKGSRLHLYSKSYKKGNTIHRRLETHRKCSFIGKTLLKDKTLHSLQQFWQTRIYRIIIHKGYEYVII